MSPSSFQLAPGPSIIILPDATCDYCRATMTVEARYIPADHSLEWACHNCEFPNVTPVEVDE